MWIFTDVSISLPNQCALLFFILFTTTFSICFLSPLRLLFFCYRKAMKDLSNTLNACLHSTAIVQWTIKTVVFLLYIEWLNTFWGAMVLWNEETEYCAFFLIFANIDGISSGIHEHMAFLRTLAIYVPIIFYYVLSF